MILMHNRNREAAIDPRRAGAGASRCSQARPRRTSARRVQVSICDSPASAGSSQMETAQLRQVDTRRNLAGRYALRATGSTRGAVKTGVVLRDSGLRWGTESELLTKAKQGPFSFNSEFSQADDCALGAWVRARSKGPTNDRRPPQNGALSGLLPLQMLCHAYPFLWAFTPVRCALSRSSKSWPSWSPTHGQSPSTSNLRLSRPPYWAKR